MIWKGTFLLAIGQLLSLLSGYGISVFLARHLGPSGYGTFGVVYSILMIIELFVVAGIPNALQKFVGENPNQAHCLHKLLFRRQLIYSFAFFALSYFLAPIIAGALKDSKITSLLRIAVFDIVAFGLYWYFNGFLIGQRHFGRQTIIAATYSISKFFFVVAFVSAGFAVAGALVGNVLASFTGMIFGVFLFKAKGEEKEVSRSGIMEFAVLNIIYSIGLHLFFYIDLWFVKYHLTEDMIGFYNAASTVGRIPYFFSIALAGALLPSLSHAIGEGRKADIERLIHQSLRSIIILVLPAMILVATSASQIVAMFFGEQYLGAAAILQRLIVGLSIFAVFAVINTIAMARDGMKGCAAIVLSLIPVDFLLNAYLVPRFGANGAALATSATMLVGVVVSSLYVMKQYKVFIRLIPAIRIFSASAVLLSISAFVQPDNHWGLFLKFFLLMIVYFAILRMVGEISQRDLDSIKAAIASRRARLKVIVSGSTNK